jgi:hypothetical protein
MNVKKLKELLVNLPDDVMVYVEADHGQQPTQANYLNYSTDKDLYYSPEDMDWNADDEEDGIIITAILIS